MHKIREILRLILSTKLSNRRIAASLQASHNTVGRYRKAAQLHQMTIELVVSLDDTQLTHLIKPASKNLHLSPAIDWERIHTELQIKGVTLQLLWEEYCLAKLTQHSYSHFARLYRCWSKKLNLTMRQAHRAGEKMFVDFSGKTVPIHLPSGEILEAQIFVAVLGASGYTYVEALRSQTIRDWTEVHVNTFNYFGGVPMITVPDNLKSAVTRTGRHGVKVNDSYLKLAQHYQTAIIPARARKPKDKAKVEGAVLLVQRWILARLRHYTFFSIESLNIEIQRLLVDYNHRSFKKRAGSRHGLYQQIDAPALRPLPIEVYAYSEWRINIKVGRDYCIEHEQHFYSVPHALVGQSVNLNISARTIEVFYKNQRVASHARSFTPHEDTVHQEHLPENHRQYREWNPRRLLIWTQSIGLSAEAVFRSYLDKTHAERNIQSCITLVEVAKQYGHARFETACERAMAIGSPTVSSIRSILQRSIDMHTPQVIAPAFQLPLHDNIRGAGYYSNK